MREIDAISNWIREAAKRYRYNDITIYILNKLVYPVVDCRQERLRRGRRKSERERERTEKGRDRKKNIDRKSVWIY